MMDDWEGKNKSVKHTHTVPVSGVAEPLSDERRLQLQLDTDTGQCANTGWLQGAAGRVHGHQVVSPRGDSAPSGAIILMSYFSNLGGAQVIYLEKLQCFSTVEIITGSTITAGEFPVAALCQRLYEKDCDSQPTAGEGKSPPAPSPTHKRRKRKEMVKFYIV